MSRLNVLAVSLAALACAHAQSMEPSMEPTREPTMSTPSPAPAPVAAVLPVSGTPQLTAEVGKLSFLHGVWKGTARGFNPDQSTFEVTQVERVGPLLGGDILLIEGRGYHPDGTTAFNAFGVLSYDPRAQKYEFRSYAQGRSGTFKFERTDDGYVWETPAGPGAIVRFTAVVKGDSWREIGEYIREGAPPVQTLEMNLTRQGDTDWPLGAPPAP